jgi:hypothetical protein
VKEQQVDTISGEDPSPAQETASVGKAERGTTSASVDAPRVRFEAEEIVRELYVGLLKREPDERGLRLHADSLAHGTPLATVIEHFLNASEFASAWESRHRGPRPPGVDWADRVHHLSEIHQRLVGRAPTGADLHAALDASIPLGNVIATIARRIDARRVGKAVRVLLFGGFGNGNIGDAYQALAVRAMLTAAWGVPKKAFSACSLLDVAPFPFDGEVLAPGAILDARVVNSFDVLVIGGGGLLAHPVYPLMVDSWARSITIPIHLLAVGANHRHAADYRRLVAQAVDVSGRDPESVAALSASRRDVRLVKDPILALGDLRVLRDAVHGEQHRGSFVHSSSVRDNSHGGTLWILKHPLNDFDRECLLLLADHIANAADGEHRVVAMEPGLDKALEEYFGPGRVEYFDSVAPLDEAIQASSRVFTMRYHGYIFATLRQKPVVGFSQPKIGSLSELLGQPQGFVSSKAELLSAIAAPPIHPIVSDVLQNVRKEFLQSAATMFYPA